MRPAQSSFGAMPANPAIRSIRAVVRTGRDRGMRLRVCKHSTSWTGVRCGQSSDARTPVFRIHHHRHPKLTRFALAPPPLLSDLPSVYLLWLVCLYHNKNPLFFQEGVLIAHSTAISRVLSFDSAYGLAQDKSYYFINKACTERAKRVEAMIISLAQILLFGSNVLTFRSNQS